MKDTVEKLLSHRKTFFSRQGEDGLLAFVLSKIPDKTGWCVEFGAWDGKSESNTYYFISQQGYHGIMIEADPLKYNLLRENMNAYGAICVNAFVRPEGKNKLDNILSLTPIPKQFDLLSIDVDGDDYHIWQSLDKYQPKVVIIEINIRDKPGVKRINKPGSPVVRGNTSTPSMWGIAGYIGTSISSMTELAISKQYSLLANVHCNAIFVRNEYLNLYHDREVTPNEVFTYEGYRIGELSFDVMRSLGWRRIIEKSRRLRRLFSPLKYNPKL
ncbi:MAG: hypothetical protein Q7J15_10920 [Candidatus Desulfaltia sp.]|nr:hypothetical protein [Candidatus Desulfaltia sp.]